MATTYHNITSKLGDAISNAITTLAGAEITGVTIFKSASMTELSTPRIEILCDAEAEVIGSTITGNYEATARVRVISNCADGARGTHNGYVAAVGDALFYDTFTAQIGTVTNFTLQQFFPRRVNESIEGDEFVTEFQCDARCWPS